MRYVNKRKYELGNIVNGKKQPVYKMYDFLISQLDEQYLSDDLFNEVAEPWENENISEEDIKRIYKASSHKKNKKLYEDTYSAHVNMRKKKSTKSKTKRKSKKKGCGCK